MENLNKYIDHTLLKPEATREQIIALCREAIEYDFKAVCVNPVWVGLVAKELAGSSVLTCSVIGFPLGATTKELKAHEAKTAADCGAQEIDMVINIGALKACDVVSVKEEIEAVVNAVRGRADVKVIIETCLLSDQEKITACVIAKEAGAKFVKTSTGFSKGGATCNDVKLMRQTVGSGMGVKASGGVRERKDALDMIAAGATRIGTSNGIAIMKG